MHDHPWYICVVGFICSFIWWLFYIMHLAPHLGSMPEDKVWTVLPTYLTASLIGTLALFYVWFAVYRVLHELIVVFQNRKYWLLMCSTKLATLNEGRRHGGGYQPTGSDRQPDPPPKKM
jgi:hypothetical protein